MVELERKSLGELLGELKVSGKKGKLSIPEYQRVYCWPEKNVKLLLNDLLLTEHTNHPYHIGTVILRYSELYGKKNWDIIDGQQRLVTLSLLLLELGDKKSPLLKCQLYSKLANEFVAYNRFLIRSFIENQGWDTKKRSEMATMLRDNTTLDTLLLIGEPIDLAYTFFSAQNNRGKALTDYELLKSHHLRYIPWEEQQVHLSKKWDKLLLEHEQEDGDKTVSIVIGFYIYCMRKWTQMDYCEPFVDKAIKTEFEAAPIIDEVPPFGESFFYNEAIQGGSHFFAFVEHFTSRFPYFQKTNAYRALWKTISCSGLLDEEVDGKVYKKDNRKRTHWWYGDVIASHLFAYYLKFGEEYLAEALICITRLISRIRYDSAKANSDTLLQNAGGMKIMQVLNRATSPTFFLAELRNMILSLPATDKEFLTQNRNRTIRDDYRSLEVMMYKEIAKDCILNFNSLCLKD